jgi:hypothetical protein
MENVATFTMHDFVKNTSRCLKEAPLIVTVRHEPRYRVSLYNEKQPIILAKEMRVKNVIKKVSDIKNLSFSGEYGCGCKREDGKVLCGKHGRV